MLCRFATALACAFSIVLLNQSTPFSKPVTKQEFSAQQEKPADASSGDAKSADEPRAQERDAESSAWNEPAQAIGSPTEAAIGKESDAKLDLDGKWNPDGKWNTSSPASPQAKTPTRESICRVLVDSAEENALPTPLFKRLIWQESRFRPDAVSPVGAKGIAQFMPRTAAERGLKNPFDPFQALPASAAFLRDLVEQFGNFGLAAAAYNGGPGRVSRWLDGKSGLPKETRDYVMQITGRTPEHWKQGSQAQAHPEAVDVRDCDVRPLQAALSEARSSKPIAQSDPSSLIERVAAGWVAMLTGTWSQQRAQVVFASLQKKYPKILGSRSPTVKVAKVGKRAKPQTLVHLAAASRAEAEEMCKRLREAGGSCTVQQRKADATTGAS